MRILFDGYWWHRGPLANRTVQRDLIATWLEEFPADDILVAVRDHKKGSTGPAELGRASLVSTRVWPHAVSNFVELPLRARRLQVDAMVVHNYTPLAGRAFTFIHDAMFAEHPEWFSRLERLYFWPMLPSARRAVRVYTSTATEAHRIGRASAGRIAAEVTGLAVPLSLAAAVPVRPQNAPPPQSFALVVGRLNIRKNLTAAIRGAMASTRIDPEHPLLVVGSSEYSGVGPKAPEEFQGAVADGSVRFLGRTPDDELSWMYRNAALSICLSLDEGFGLPSIEAAHFGSPLLASDIPVFNETVGGHATFVDPMADAVEVGAAIDRCWASPVDPAALARIRERYTWPAAVRRLRESMAAAVGHR